MGGEGVKVKARLYKDQVFRAGFEFARVGGWVERERAKGEHRVMKLMK